MIVFARKNLSKNEIIPINEENLKNHSLIVGQSGSGKSYLVVRLIEEILLRTKARIVIFDPNGDCRLLKNVNDDIWNNKTFSQTLKINSETSNLESIPDFDSKSSFEKKWAEVKGLEIIPDLLEDLKLNGRTFRTKLRIHWSNLEDESKELLKVDPLLHPELSMGLSICLKELNKYEQYKQTLT